MLFIENNLLFPIKMFTGYITSIFAMKLFGCYLSLALSGIRIPGIHLGIQN